MVILVSRIYISRHRVRDDFPRVFARKKMKRNCNIRAIGFKKINRCTREWNTVSRDCKSSLQLLFAVCAHTCGKFAGETVLASLEKASFGRGTVTGCSGVGFGHILINIPKVAGPVAHGNTCSVSHATTCIGQVSDYCHGITL